jgi:uncharacterized protein YgiM (DUF1202 family)
MKTAALVLLLSISAFAKTYIIKTDRANAYDSPSASATAVGHVVKGKRVNSVGEDEGYIQVNTKSGRSMWIKLSDLQEEQSDVSDDVAGGSDEQKIRDSSNDGYPMITWDLGSSFGQHQTRSYTEVDLGINVWFYNWLNWRNAAFMRMVEPKNYYGLDTSGQLAYSLALIRVYGGPGYRFVSDGGGWNVPFIEGGLSINIGGFSLGGGVKVIYNSFADKNVADDTMISINIAGSGIIN